MERPIMDRKRAHKILRALLKELHENGYRVHDLKPETRQAVGEVVDYYGAPVLYHGYGLYFSALGLEVRSTCSLDETQSELDELNKEDQGAT